MRNALFVRFSRVCTKDYVHSELVQGLLSREANLERQPDYKGKQMLQPRFRPINPLATVFAIVTLFAAGCASINKLPPPEVVQAQPTPQAEVAAPRVTPAPAAEPVMATPERAMEINPAAPESYVVQKGDTLWDISAKFLKDPWYWPEIWHVNTQIENPHLIYPGDVLSLYYVGGKPYLQVTGGPRIGTGRTRLSPRIRAQALDAIDTALPVQAIQQLIIHPRVLPKEVLDSAPYVVGSHDNRLIYGANDKVYVRRLEGAAPGNRYTVLRPGKPLHDPVTDELLGYEAIQVADATVVRGGDPATVALTQTKRETLKGDRLLPYDTNDENRNFVPRPPAEDVGGTIISLFDALSQIGQHQVAVMNLGTHDGVERGHVFAVYEAGRVINDAYAEGKESKRVRLPDEKTAVVMIFRPFEKVSYALVMDAERPIHIGDTVRAP